MTCSSIHLSTLPLPIVSMIEHTIRNFAKGVPHRTLASPRNRGSIMVGMMLQRRSPLMRVFFASLPGNALTPLYVRNVSQSVLFLFRTGPGWERFHHNLYWVRKLGPCRQHAFVGCLIVAPFLMSEAVSPLVSRWFARIGLFGEEFDLASAALPRLRLVPVACPSMSHLVYILSATSIVAIEHYAAALRRHLPCLLFSARIVSWEVYWTFQVPILRVDWPSCFFSFCHQAMWFAQATGLPRSGESVPSIFDRDIDLHSSECKAKEMAITLPPPKAFEALYVRFPQFVYEVRRPLIITVFHTDIGRYLVCVSEDIHNGWNDPEFDAAGRQDPRPSPGLHRKRFDPHDLFAWRPFGWIV